MGIHHGRVNYEELLVYKYLNKFSSKFGNVKCFSSFFGILVFTYAFIKLNNVAALTSAILICISYLVYDFVVASEVEEKLVISTQKLETELIQEKTEQEKLKKNYIKEELKYKNKTLSDENEELKKQLQIMENDKYRVLKKMKEELVRVIKSECGKNKQSLTKEISKLKWWVLEKVCGGQEEEVSRLDKRCEKLVVERDEMVKRVANLEERLKAETAEGVRSNVVQEKLDALMDVLNQHLVDNENNWGYDDDAYHVGKDDYY